MRQTIVRSAIIVFGLLCVAVVILIAFSGNSRYKELDSLAARLDSDPSSQRLRDLLNYPADGAYSYYKTALTGALFSRHPSVFREIYDDLRTDQETRSIEMLMTLGERVFEYHPELKPPEFDQRFQEQTWLIPKTD